MHAFPGNARPEQIKRNLLVAHAALPCLQISPRSWSQSHLDGSLDHANARQSLLRLHAFPAYDESLSVNLTPVCDNMRVYANLTKAIILGGLLSFVWKNRLLQILYGFTKAAIITSSMDKGSPSM